MNDSPAHRSDRRGYEVAHVHSVSGMVTHNNDGDQGGFVFDVALSGTFLDIADTAFPGMTASFLK